MAIFEKPTVEDWRALVDQSLKGQDFEQRLVSHTLDDIRLDPIYPDTQTAPHQPIQPIAPYRHWTSLQRIDHQNLDQAIAQAEIDISEGADGLEIIAASAHNAYGYGLDVHKTPSDLSQLFDLELSDKTLHLHGALIDIDRIFEALANGTTPSNEITVRVGYDPLLAASQAGQPIEADTQAHYAALMNTLAHVEFSTVNHLVQAQGWANFGATTAQELALALSSGVTYLRWLEGQNSDLDQLVPLIGFTLSANADQFESMAKVRAFKVLWPRILAASSLEPTLPYIHMETAYRMMSRIGADVNMLRATTASFSAITGGANSLTVLPHDIAKALPDQFSRRIARNTQLVLLQESRLGFVHDPAAGSGVLEYLTSELIEAAWAMFQEIEALGGLMPALQAGLVQDKITSARALRQSLIAKRSIALTGVSEFPYLGEDAIATVKEDDDTVGKHQDENVSKAVFAPLQPARLATDYEDLRAKSDQVLSTTGQRPQIYMANLGRISDFNMRATFISNAFAAGGIEAKGNEEQKSLDELIAAFQDSPTSQVIICSCDTVYADQALAAVKAFKSADANQVYLAGHPKDLAQDLQQAGVNHFITQGIDLVAFLEGFYQNLGDKS